MGFIAQPRRAVLAGFWLLAAIAVLFISTPTAVQAGDRSARVSKALASLGRRTGTEPGREYRRKASAGKGVDGDIRRLCKGAKKGDANDQFDLGYLYAVGRGVKRNEALAAAWFLKAAKQKQPQAENWLSRLQVKPQRRAECLLSNGLPLGGNRKLAAHPARGAIADLVRDLAPEYRLSPDLVLAVVEAESNFNPQAVSPKNAQGLMQLIPATAQRFGVNNVWDPEQNLRGGMAYLRWLLDHFNGDIRLALAGYNAGEQAVRRHGGIPPYDETRNYVSRISRRLNL
jgi:soluble lytic murein transglycosylase-like protein